MSKPKILITGFNKNQCTRKFYLRQQLKVVPSHYSLVNCLLDMGYDVEQRQVELGEDLSAYDEVIVFIAGPRQLVATTVYEGLWAISQRPDCVLAFDDWQVPDLFKGVANAASEEGLFAQFILDVNKKTLEVVQPYAKELLGAIDVITAKKNRMLISAFQAGHLNEPEAYGPHLLFDKIDYPRDRLFVYNPNPYHRNRTWEDSAHEGKEDPTFKQSLLSYTVSPRPAKERRFNFASLVQSKTQKWLKQQGFVTNKDDDETGTITDTHIDASKKKNLVNFSAEGRNSWPVDLYGSKAESQKRLTEDEMVQTFTRDWACLMPGYEHAGSGWWRARPLQAADAGCILIGEKKELEVYYGKDFPLLDLKASDLVNASDEELAEIAAMQKEALYRIHPLDKTVQQAELRAVLVAVK